jgi:hypothetical protein
MITTLAGNTAAHQLEFGLSSFFKAAGGVKTVTFGPFLVYDEH